MEASRPKKKTLWGDERGFTLPEVLITIVLMGIVFGIATASWQGVVQSREVDSATNQLVADLRKAHSTATNRLAPQMVSLTAGNSEYSVTGSPSALDLDDDPDDDTVSVDTTVAVAFCPDGSAEVPASSPPCPNGKRSSTSTNSPTSITVSLNGGTPSHVVELIPATSRVEIDPQVT